MSEGDTEKKWGRNKDAYSARGGTCRTGKGGAWAEQNAVS
jgi:hypothetical protein